MSCGSVDYSPKFDAWKVSLKPHIAVKFKRVFPQVPKGARTPFVLRDRPELAMDLRWFFSRYPVTETNIATANLDEKINKYNEQQDDLRDINSEKWTPTSDYAFNEGLSPYRYQARAAEIARNSGSLLLMDDVGLGKTVSALAAISHQDFLPAIIVVQPHLAEQWAEDYIKRFTKLRTVSVKKTKPHLLPPADVYIFRYSNIAGWIDYFIQLNFKSVVFDEIQELRHGTDTKKGLAAVGLVADARMVMGLTATPIYNYGNEIFNVLNYVNEGCLGNEIEFRTEWCPGGITVSDPPALGSYLRHENIALRRTEDSSEVNLDLPSLRKNLHEVDWNEDDSASDEELQQALAKTILTGRFTERGQAARELDIMMRQTTGVAKARSVAAYTRMLVESGEKVILAGWHRRVYEIWNEALSDLQPVMFTGSESQRSKRLSKENFVEGDSQVMLLSLRSGAGLDGLQHACSNVVFGELDWSPQIHTQVIGRLRRFGQRRPVTAHFLHVDGGSDPLMIELNGLKADQAHGIVDPFSAPRPAHDDTSRMTKLAKQILGDSDIKLGPITSTTKRNSIG